MKFNLNSFLIGVSVALDMAEKNIFNVSTYHSRRVAYIAVRIAKKLGMSKEECFDICSLSILHDNGLTESALIYDLDPISSMIDLEHVFEHCQIGENNVKNYPFLTSVTNVILYHHENYDGTGFYGKSGTDIPIMSRIISFSDVIDCNLSLIDSSLSNKNKIISYTKEIAGKTHDPEIAHVFLELMEQTSFWLDLQEPYIDHALTDLLPDISLDLEYSDIFEITNIFSKIIDAKSKSTALHTHGIIEKSEVMGNYYKYDPEKIFKIKIAASLHDLGKLAVSNAIIDKPDKLTDEEYEQIKTHPYLAYFMLRGILGFDEEIKQWIYTHHEKLNGSGYPLGLKSDDLGFEQRLLTCIDIYQALRENRPYRDGMNHDKAMSIMHQMASKNEIDLNIVKDIDVVFAELV